MNGRPSLVVIGAGPRGTGLIERIAANAPELYGHRPLDLHLVDPYPPGAGRIWRHDQSPLLWMNSMAEDVTMFTDDTVRQDGPIRPGPAAGRLGGGRARGPDPAIRRRGRARTPRRDRGAAGAGLPEPHGLQGAYLRWVYEQSVAALPPSVTVHEHRGRALDVTGPSDGPQRVRLEGRAEPLLADLVVLTIGHLDAEPDAGQQALSAFDKAGTASSICRPTSPPTATSPPCARANPSSSGASGSPSSTSWCC